MITGGIPVENASMTLLRVEMVCFPVDIPQVFSNRKKLCTTLVRRVFHSINTPYY